MNSTIRPVYAVAGSTGMNDFTARVIIDKKNSSIHIHYYGKMFGSPGKPILVKHTNNRFPEDEGADLVRQIIVDEFTNNNVQIKKITKEKEPTKKQIKPQQRTIIRFRKKTGAEK